MFEVSFVQWIEFVVLFGGGALFGWMLNDIMKGGE